MATLSAVFAFLLHCLIARLNNYSGYKMKFQKSAAITAASAYVKNIRWMVQYKAMKAMSMDIG